MGVKHVATPLIPNIPEFTWNMYTYYFMGYPNQAIL